MQSIRVIAAGFGLSALLVAAPVPAATAGAPGDITANGSLPADVVINEFAPSGFGKTDEFIELRNVSSEVVTIGGWELWTCLSFGFPVRLVVFGPSNVIVPGGYLLLAHVDSSGSEQPDLRYGGWDVPDDGGWLLTDPWSGQFDGVGLRQGVDCTEGDPAPQCDWDAGEAVTRDEQGKDTDDNAVDLTCEPRTPGT